MAKYKVQISIFGEKRGDPVDQAQVGQLLFDLRNKEVLGADMQIVLDIGMTILQDQNREVQITFSVSLDELVSATTKLAELGVRFLEKTDRSLDSHYGKFYIVLQDDDDEPPIS